MKELILSTLLACLLFSCTEKAQPNGSGHPEFMANQDFTLAIGKTMQLKGSDFTLEFVEVKEDSRCPEGVNCVRAGEVTFSLKSQDGTLHEITKKPRKATKTIIGDYNIMVSEVNPYPKNGVMTDKATYVLKMQVAE